MKNNAWQATDWEFEQRAWLLGMTFWVMFPLYVIDPQNCMVVVANWLSTQSGWDADFLVRWLFVAAALVIAVAALIRSWASAYLHADVVYAAVVKTESLVADGPYRFVRNPLYFANVLLAVGFAAMMSRSGAAATVVLMLGFCYRLIFREEAELASAQGDSYARYRHAVPRLWPRLTPGVPSAGRQSRWGAGFTAELWCWGFAVAVLAFAFTLSMPVYFGVLAVSLIWFFWIGPRLQRRSAGSPEIR